MRAYHALLVLPLLIASPLRSQTVVFHSDFDAALPAEVQPGLAMLEGVQGYAGLGPVAAPFGGNFLRSPTGNPVRVQLSNLPPHDTIRIDVLFAAIDSLDGTGTFPSGDFLAISIDGNVFFRESFANALPSQVQSYVSPPGVELARRVDLGFSGPGSFYTDSAYWFGGDPRFQAIGHSASNLTIEMQIEGPGIQSLADESWAIDELTISVATTGVAGSATAYGASCGPVLSALTTPRIGQPVPLFLSGIPAGTALPFYAVGLGDTSYASVPLPLPLAVLGAPGCFLHHDVAVEVGVGMQAFGAAATSSIAIPSLPTLVGFTFYLQGWVLAPGVNALGIVTSNGLKIVLGA